MRPKTLIKFLLLLLTAIGLLGTGGGGFCSEEDPSLGITWKLDNARKSAQRTPVWSSDGRWIVINDGLVVDAVESNGEQVREFSDRTIGCHRCAGYASVSPTVSPDGTRIALATFRHGPQFNFDIATVSIDGSDYQRLTDSKTLETNPAWSPSGDLIAFISTRVPEELLDHPQARHRYQRLYVMATDGSGLRVVNEPFNSVLVEHPVWSADSSRLAFLSREKIAEGSEHYRTVLYTVGPDGNNLRKISASNLRPAWSPTGARLAFGAQSTRRANARLYTARSDGSELQEVVPPGSYRNIIDLSWSPDGSEVRFAGMRLRSPERDDGMPLVGIHVVRTDGSSERTIAKLLGSQHIAWSPDETRIAVFIYPWGLRGGNYIPGFGSNVALYTVAADGSDMRVLARRSIGGTIVAEHGDWRDERVDLSVCVDGFVVPEPDKNPGLVRDCETLLQSRSTLAGKEAPLLWDSRRPISKWTGVKVEGDPPRVRKLSFDNTVDKLRGTIPPQLGNLDELRFLTVKTAGMSGPIPPELGNLTNLEGLYLSYNGISGRIPAAIGNLTNLKYIDLHQNALSANIPPELGKLTNLKYLFLGKNQLTGSIPPELGLLPHLESLDLKQNELTGCIPRELTSSPTLGAISHDGLEAC